jgi:hypothetical protein
MYSSAIGKIMIGIIIIWFLAAVDLATLSYHFLIAHFV